jgi:transposase
LDARELKGLEIAARCRIDYKDGVWLVPSQSGKGAYRVTLKRGGDNCTCDDFSLTAKPCKHIFAARLVRERDHGGAAVPLDTETLPERKKYPRDERAFNVAQSVEKHRFQELLFQLLKGVGQPAAVEGKRGRKPHTLRDMLFAVCYKVYSTFAARRFTCDLQDAHAKGYLSKSIPGQKVSAFMENPELFPVLKKLITASALPLAAVETVFAPDSSGFSTSRFVRWYDEKYGVTRSGKEWVKVHILTGARTNVVTAVEILDKDAADCPQFAPLVLATAAAGFTIREVPADKAYLSHGNLELVAALGGTAFVPFKVNSVGEGGGIWEKMFGYFQYRREEFLRHYHQRSNVESTFSAVKAKFGDAVRSRTDAAMKNECLAKFLGHNLCRLIQAQIELGVEAVFWPPEKMEAPAGADILPLVRPV